MPLRPLSTLPSNILAHLTHTSTMAREATPAGIIKPTQSQRISTRTRRPTPLRTSLLASGSNKKVAAPTPPKNTRRASSNSLAARNRVDDAENEPIAYPTALPQREVWTHSQHEKRDLVDNEAGRDRNNSSLTHHSLSTPHATSTPVDPCSTPPYRALTTENRLLAHRISSLEFGPSASFPFSYISLLPILPLFLLFTNPNLFRKRWPQTHPTPRAVAPTRDQRRTDAANA